MKEVRRIKITTTQRRILRVRPALVCAPCPVCGCEVTALSTREAQATLEVDSLQFDELLAAGRIHAIPLVSGGRRICRDSLFGSVQ